MGARRRSTPGREKKGGKMQVNTWAEKKWGQDAGHNLGGKKAGARRWSKPGREKSRGKMRVKT